MAADLDKLGPCVYSSLPSEYLQNMDPAVFVNKFSKLGNGFQPNSNDVATVQSLITYKNFFFKVFSLIFKIISFFSF